MADGAGHYATLDLPRNADIAAVKSAYRRLARKYHPDIAPHGADRFRQISEAYAALSHPETRMAYDRISDQPVGKEMVDKSDFRSTTQRAAWKIGASLMLATMALAIAIIILESLSVIPSH